MYGVIWGEYASVQNWDRVVKDDHTKLGAIPANRKNRFHRRVDSVPPLDWCEWCVCLVLALVLVVVLVVVGDFSGGFISNYSSRFIIDSAPFIIKIINC